MPQATIKSSHAATKDCAYCKGDWRSHMLRLRPGTAKQIKWNPSTTKVIKKRESGTCLSLKGSVRRVFLGTMGYGEELPSAPLENSDCLSRITSWGSSTKYLFLCCWKRVFSITSALSWQNSISLCPASFCTPRPNFPVTPGVSWLPTFAYKTSFLFCYFLPFFQAAS